MRYLVWYSCGIASAVAAHITICEGHKDVEIAYCDTGSEHPDNQRFLAECEKLFQQGIVKLKSDKYNDIWDVFDTGYLVSPKGAMCTTQLKKKVRQKFQKWDDIQVFGYTADERHRAERLIEQNPEINIYTPLIERNMTKQDCFDYFNRFGIKRPAMYDLGFNNNNCIGCVKGGMGYWNHIRKHFPDVFDRMVETEKRLKRTVIRVETGEIDKEGKKIKEPWFLADLPPNRVVHKGLFREDLFSHAMSCDFLCGGDESA
jgi:hypothetical protein